MSERRTLDERIEELERKEEQMKAQRRQLQKRRNIEERKARTRRLIQIGAEVENVLGRPITEEELPRLRSFLKGQEDRGHYFSKAMSECQHTETEKPGG